MANPEQRPIGDVSVPLNTGDVREFKKEMGRLLEDPLGVAERLDQFLRLNIYTWVELQSILGILFTMEEREMIRHSGMRVWDRDSQGPDQGDQEWPMQDPEDNFEISNTVWYSDEAGNLNIQPISVEIQNPEIPIRVKQYPISLEGQKGLKPIGGITSLEEPGGRRLIHPVIQGMQMTAMPIDPELAAKGKPNPLMVLKAKLTHTQKKGPEEMLTEHKETTVAQEMSTKFEKEREKLDTAREMLEKLEAEMREHENLDYWEYRRN
ncbi:hypothetical protein DUI87_34400 [Hirundo rustica rustica]|uniref:Core shell protein Gag P30 domain-containing protein n=1 Tax=Hirundo rustica rustica TaxID=333673 RepID=A0A3M0IMB3_HIRRU|nr:hypothetical protein DUI87_34400 [Hirundo rustica rustica]